MKQRKVYDREFKESAIKLSYKRDNLSQFSRELGVSVKQLYSWRSQYKIKGTDSFPSSGKQLLMMTLKHWFSLRKSMLVYNTKKKLWASFPEATCNLFIYKQLSLSMEYWDDVSNFKYLEVVIIISLRMLKVNVEDKLRSWRQRFKQLILKLKGVMEVIVSKKNFVDQERKCQHQ